MSQIAFIFVILSLWMFVFVHSGSKYSEEVNTMMNNQQNDKEFRMQKLNILWDKARKRLSPDKLKMLKTELKIQDKEELTWKRIKAEGQDKDGLKESELRKKLKGIMNRYDLTDDFSKVDKVAKLMVGENLNEASDKDGERLIFKDKKLNRLWEKAERSGFSEDELKTLKEEFQHHQEKIDDYYMYMEKMSTKEVEMDNSIEKVLETNISKDMSSTKQALKEKHRDLKMNYDRLGKIATLGPEDKDFEEQKVAELWKLAQKADFDRDELDSLKEELKHFEHRVKKLSHMQAQIELAEASNKWTEDRAEDKKRMEQKIKQYSHKIDKVHMDLEGRIMQRHLEL